MTDSFQGAPLSLSGYPSSLDALRRLLLPFPFRLQTPGAPRESPRQNSQVPIPGDALGPGRGSSAGSRSPPPLRLPFLNESGAGAGGAAAASSPGLWLPLPSVPTGHMRQVQSPQCAGRRGRPPRGVNPFFSSFDFELTSWLLSVHLFQPAASSPPEIQQRQATPKWATCLPLPSCVYSPIQGF